MKFDLLEVEKGNPDLMGESCYELNNHRKNEKTMSYAEFHAQALVGVI